MKNIFKKLILAIFAGILLCPLQTHAQKTVKDLVGKKWLGKTITDLPTEEVRMLNRSGHMVKIKLFYKTDNLTAQPAYLQKYWQKFEKTDEFKHGLKLRHKGIGPKGDYVAASGRTPDHDFSGAVVVKGAVFDRIEITPFDDPKNRTKIFQDPILTDYKVTIRPSDAGQTAFDAQGKLLSNRFIIMSAPSVRPSFNIYPITEKGFKFLLMVKVVSLIGQEHARLQGEAHLERVRSEKAAFQRTKSNGARAQRAQGRSHMPELADASSSDSLPGTPSEGSKNERGWWDAILEASATASQTAQEYTKWAGDKVGELLSPRQAEPEEVPLPELRRTSSSGSSASQPR